MALIPPIKENDWVGLRQALEKLSTISLGTGAYVTHGTMTLTNLTSTRLTKSDASLTLQSVTTLSDFVHGTANEIDVADDGSGGVNIGIVDPLAVNKGGTGQSSYTDGQLLIGNTTGNTLAKNTLTGTTNQVNVTNGAGTITLSLPQDIHTGATPNFVGLVLSGATITNPGGAIVISGSGAGSTGVAISAVTLGPFGANVLINTDNVSDAGSILIRPGNSSGVASIGGGIELTPGTGVAASGRIFCNGKTRIQSLSGLLTGTSGVVSAITDNSANWNTAYGWGNHASAGYLAAEVDTLDTVLARGDTSATHNITLTAGTVMAEQLTSTDDVTMAGKLLNTLAATDVQGMNFDGTTYPYVFAGTEALTFYNLDRQVNDGGSAISVHSSPQKLLSRSLTWNVSFLGSAAELNGDKIYGDYSVFTHTSPRGSEGYICNANATPATLKTFKEYAAKSLFVANTIWGITTGYPNTKVMNYQLIGYSAEFSGAALFQNDAGSTGVVQVDVIGGEFLSNLIYTVSGAGTINVNFYGGRFIAAGSTTGTSVAYGGYFSGNGCDTNYDCYAANAGSENYFAGLVNAVSGVQIGIAPTANSTGTVAIVAKDAALLTANAEWIPIKNSSGVTRYIPVWA